MAVNDISLHPKGAATSPIAPGLRGGQREVEPELAARRLDFVIMFLVSRIWCWRLVSAGSRERGVQAASPAWRVSSSMAAS